MGGLLTLICKLLISFYIELQEKEREQAEELEAVRRAARDATAAFNDVRQRRYEIFMAAFEHISAAIDPIFKDLTRSQQHVLGGQVFSCCQK